MSITFGDIFKDPTESGSSTAYIVQCDHWMRSWSKGWLLIVIIKEVGVKGFRESQGRPQKTLVQSEGPSLTHCSAPPGVRASLSFPGVCSYLCQWPRPLKAGGDDCIYQEVEWNWAKVKRALLLLISWWATPRLLWPECWLCHQEAPGGKTRWPVSGPPFLHTDLPSFFLQRLEIIPWTEWHRKNKDPIFPDLFHLVPALQLVRHE